MKRIVFALLVALASATVSAQQNPERGFVITNDNDTIYGTIDYRTDEMNATKCTFKADDKNEFRTYLPGEILGYRFSNNGRFYISKEFEIEEKRSLVFAEYMIKGVLNVYRVRGISYDDIYFFENEMGEIQSYKSYTNLATVDEKTITKNSRDLYNFLSHSSFSSADEVKTKPMKARDIINIARTYHEDVCTSGEDCIKYEFDDKNDNNRCAYYVTLGVFHYFETKYYNSTTLFPMIGIGISPDMSRLVKNTSLQFNLDLYHDKEMNIPIWFNTKLGLQRWTSTGKGIKFMYNAGLSMAMLESLGLYAGVGIDIPISKKMGIVANIYVVPPSWELYNLFNIEDKYSGCQLQLTTGIRF